MLPKIFSATKQIVEIESENDSFLCYPVTSVVVVSGEIWMSPARCKRVVELLEMKVFVWLKDRVF
jgi:hypothetical protein